MMNFIFPYRRNLKKPVKKMDKIKSELIFDGSVARVTLDDGKGNVLDSKMMEELSGFLHSFKGMNNLKAMIIEGAGKHFSFGASVEEHRAEYAGQMLSSFHNLFYIMSDLSIPSIAMISGQCLGGGLELAMMCNLMFADKSAKLGQPEIQLGVFAPPASVILKEKVGLSKAEEILISGRSLGSDEALSIGLLNGVFDDRQQLESGVIEWVEKNILPKSASSLRYAVRAVRAELYVKLRSTLPMLEKMYVNDLMKTNDANEGINSFLERRTPDWKNS